MDNKKLQEAAKMIVEATSNGGASNSAHNDESEWIPIKEACKITNFSRWTISRWLRMKDSDGNYLIRWSKSGPSKNSPVRINRASFKAFLETKVQYAKKDGAEE